MTQLTTPTDAEIDGIFRRQRRRTLLLLMAAVGACFAAAIGFMFYDRAHPGQSSAGEDNVSHLMVLISWAAIAAAYAVGHYRPKAPYNDEAVMRRRADMLQAKRARLLMLNAGYVGLLLTPLAIAESLGLKPGASVVDRLFDAVLFIGPCAVVVALITGFNFSKATVASVEDELTAANRASGVRAGFAVMLLAGAAAYLAALFRPEWSLAALPAVIGLGIAAAGLRFAQLEHRASAGLDD